MKIMKDLNRSIGTYRVVLPATFTCKYREHPKEFRSMSTSGMTSHLPICNVCIRIALIVLCFLSIDSSAMAQEILWQQSFSSELGFKSASYIDICSDGEILVAGQNGPGGAVSHLSKISSKGDLRWTRAAVEDDSYVVSRSCRELEPGKFRFEGIKGIAPGPFAPMSPYVMDVDNDGHVVFSNSDPKLDNILYYSRIIQQETTGGYRSASQLLNSDPPVFSVRYLNSNAEFERKNEYLGISSDSSAILSCSEILNDGSMVVAGEIRSSESRNHLMLSKIDDNGDLVWDKRISPGRQFWLRAMIEDHSGNLYVVGNAQKEDQNDKKIYIVVLKIDSDGEAIWTGYYAVKDVQDAHSIVETSQNTFVIVGSAGDYDESGKVLEEGSSDALIIHIGSDSALLWQSTFGQTGVTDVLLCIRELDNHTFIVGGVGNENQMLISNVDILKSTGLKEVGLSPAKGRVLPHPVLKGHPAFVRFQTDKTNALRVKIYDSLGRLLVTTHTGLSAAGSQEIILPTSGLNTGSYYYDISGDETVLVSGTFLVK